MAGVAGMTGVAGVVGRPRMRDRAAAITEAGFGADAEPEGAVIEEGVVAGRVVGA
jgi:hypothetical protein